MRLLIALLLQNPELVKFVPDISALKTLEEPGFELLLELVEVCRQKVGVSMGALLEHWRDKPNYRTLELLVDWEHLVTSENIETTFIETLDFLYAKLVEKRIEVLIAKDRSLGLSAEEKQELVMLIAQ